MVLVGYSRCMKDVFNVSDLIMAEETGLVVARSMPKPVPEKKNDLYLIVEVPLTISHDCYSVKIPTFVESINHFRLELCSSAYKYRINHGEWIDVDAEGDVAEKDFDVESLDISNAVGVDTLTIYLEGICNTTVGV